MAKLRALDLFCCAGGASMGLHRAGFEVVGVDCVDIHRHYPYISTHGYWTHRTPEWAVSCLARVSDLCHRTMGAIAQWAPAEPDLPRLQKQGEQTHSSPRRQTTSALERRTLHDDSGLCRGLGVAGRSICLDEEQGRLRLRAPFEGCQEVRSAPFARGRGSPPQRSQGRQQTSQSGSLGQVRSLPRDTSGSDGAKKRGAALAEVTP